MTLELLMINVMHSLCVGCNGWYVKNAITMCRDLPPTHVTLHDTYVVLPRIGWKMGCGTSRQTRGKLYNIFHAATSYFY